jgi:dienelactone hydrolase
MALHISPISVVGGCPPSLAGGINGTRISHSISVASQLLSDIQAAINYLTTLPEVNPEKFGCIGFYFGGHVAYLVATLPDIQVTPSFYNARITTSTPEGGEPTINRTKDIQGTLYTSFGIEDASIPETEVDQIVEQLGKYNISHRVFRYDRYLNMGFSVTVVPVIILKRLRMLGSKCNNFLVNSSDNLHRP